MRFIDWTILVLLLVYIILACVHLDKMMNANTIERKERAELVRLQIERLEREGGE